MGRQNSSVCGLYIRLVLSFSSESWKLDELKCVNHPRFGL